MKGDEGKLSSLVMPLSHASCHDSARLCGFPLHLIRIYPSHDPKFRHFVLCITNPVQPRLSSAFMQNWIFAGIGGWDKGFPVKELRQGARGWGRERGVSNYCNYRRAAPPPTRSLPIPTPTARVPRTRREGGGAKLLRAAEGRDPYSRKVVRTPEAPVPLPRRAGATSSTPHFGRPSHLSGRHDHSLTVPVHTNQDLWVLLWSPFPTFGALCSTRSPLPAATGFPMQSFSRQNLLASSSRKRAHLCRKAGRRALSYPVLSRRATSVDRPGRGCPFKHWPCPVQNTRRRVWYWCAPWWEWICESQSETASGMCSAGRLTVLQRGAESSIQTEWASVGHRPKTGFLAALSLQGLHR